MNSVNIQTNARNNFPAISVIVPAFNAEHTIARTLNSLLSQSIVNEIEVIVINDGSKDKTFNEVSKFINKYSLDWKLISQKNSGEAAARNTGLDICSGKFILFLDADDSIVNNAIETLLANANNNNCDLVFSSYRKIISYNQYQDYLYDNSIYTSNDLLHLYFQRRIVIGIGNTLILSSLVKKNNLRFKNYRAGADNHFFRNYLRFVEKGSSESEILFNYHVNDDSIMTSTYSESRLDSILSVLDTRKILIENNSSQKVLDSLNVFLINEIRGNVKDYLRLSKPFYSKQKWLFVKTNILTYMPKKINWLVFVGKKRLIWTLVILLFYIFPRFTMYTELLFLYWRKLR